MPARVKHRFGHVESLEVMLHLSRWNWHSAVLPGSVPAIRYAKMLLRTPDEITHQLVIADREPHAVDLATLILPRVIRNEEDFRVLT